MEFALEAASDGRRIRIKTQEPLLLKVKRGNQPGGEIAVGMKDGQPFLDNRSSAVCQVNGIERAAFLLKPGDELQLGAQCFRLVQLGHDIEVIEPAVAAPAVATPVAAKPAPAQTNDSDRQRQQRRISASRMASVEAPANATSGLLKMVSSAFTGRAEKQRLDQLETERRAALVVAGRRSLSDGTALGLPGRVMAQLQRGQAVTLRAEDLDGLARWREERQGLVRLDAEIAALRQTLGLGPDHDAVVLSTPTLRSSELAKDERAFATMDAVGTQMLDPPPAAPPMRQAPARRRR